MLGRTWILLGAATFLTPVAARAQEARATPERKVSLEVYQTPLREALDRLSTGSGTRVTVAPNVPNVLVSVTVRDVPLETALRLLTRAAASKAPGVGFWPEEGAYAVRVGGIFRRPAAGPADAPVDTSALAGRLVTLSLQDTPLRRAVDALFGQVGANYMVNRDMPDAPITLHVQDLPFDQALELFTQEARDQVPTFNIKKVGETYLARTRTDDVRPQFRPTEEFTVQDPTDSRFMIAKIALRSESVFVIARTLGFETLITEAQLFKDSFGGQYPWVGGQLGQNNVPGGRYSIFSGDRRRGQ